MLLIGFDKGDLVFPQADIFTIESKIERTLSFIDSSKPRNEGICVHYPGEGMKRIREESMRSGVYVADSVWAKIEALL